MGRSSHKIPKMEAIDNTILTCLEFACNRCESKKLSLLGTVGKNYNRPRALNGTLKFRAFHGSLFKPEPRIQDRIDGHQTARSIKHFLGKQRGMAAAEKVHNAATADGFSNHTGGSHH